MAIKVGIVGMNGIGNQHADCHSKDELSDLRAVCDIVKERADAAAERFGVKAYYNLADMIKNEDLDMVDVTTGGYENGSWHFQPAMQALDAGKHVLVEKPICNNIDEARQLVKFAADKKLYLGCNLNHYFTSASEYARKLIDEDKIGEQIYCLFKMGFNGGEFTYRPDKSPRANGWPYFHMKAFLTHPFSVMRYFCGDITHIQTFSTTPGFRRTKGDVMLSVNAINVRFRNGTVGHLLSQRGDCTFGLGGWWSCELAGSKGTFVIENCVEKTMYWAAPQPGKALGTMNQAGNAPDDVFESGLSDFSATFPNRIHCFVEDLTNNVPRESIRASGRDALAVLEYTWAAMESYENGGEMMRVATLPPIQGDPADQRGLYNKGYNNL